MKSSKKIWGLCIALGVTFLGVIFLSTKVISKAKDSAAGSNSGLAIMIQNQAGKYEKYDKNTWPTDMYVFDKGVCDNNSEISWDSVTKSVMLTSNKSDRCTIYFKQMPMADYIKSLYTADGEKGLYYHDGVGTYSTLEAADKSYRYSGANSIVNNYVCFGSDADSCPYENLYRIIGIFDEDSDGTYQVKLIKADYADETQLGKETGGTVGTYYNIHYGNDTSNNNEEKDAFHHRYKGKLTSVPRYRWQKVGDTNTTADWPTALLNTVHLNKNYYGKFSGDWQKLIDNHDWHYKGGSWGEIVGGSPSSNTKAKSVFDKEMSDQTTHQNHIGLMYVSDYLYGANPDFWDNVPYNGTYQYIAGGNADDGFPQGSYQDNPDKPDYRSASEENWLYMGLWEWLITQRTDASGVHAFDVTAPGYVSNYYVGTNSLVVRPVLYLTSDARISGGEGTSTNPYRVGIN